EKAAEVEDRLRQPEVDVSQLGRRSRELRRHLPGRGQRALRTAYERSCALAVLRRKHGDSLVRSFGEPGHVAQPLALGAKRVLRARLEAFGVLDECPQLREPRLLGGRALAQLVMPSASRAEVTPRRTQLAT